jgi:hypothetical protein
LSPLSAHHMGVHFSWPNAVRNSCLALSSSNADGLRAAEQLNSWFRHFSIPILSPGSRANAPEKKNTLWVPLPYHPGTHKELVRTLVLFKDEMASHTSRVFESQPSVGTVFNALNICWRNSMPNLNAKLRSLF